MKSYANQIVFIFCILFTALVLIYFATFGDMPAHILKAILCSSFFSSLFTFLLYPKSTHSHRRILFQQFIYVFIVMCIILFISFILDLEISIWSIGINLLTVIALFVGIKWLLYQKDQKTAIEINERIKQRSQSNS
ncbi:cadmium resistance transporter [Bacillus sp. NPDC077027]|uniref:cadmium resistance transporter n=1 Tax=Bacillus sp. NPDC077027 TaxID=3390548 RepID=UPI003D07178B